MVEQRKYEKHEGGKDNSMTKVCKGRLQNKRTIKYSRLGKK